MEQNNPLKLSSDTLFKMAVAVYNGLMKGSIMMTSEAVTLFVNLLAQARGQKADEDHVRMHEEQLAAAGIPTIGKGRPPRSN